MNLNTRLEEWFRDLGVETHQVENFAHLVHKDLLSIINGLKHQETHPNPLTAEFEKIYDKALSDVVEAITKYVGED